MLHYLSESVVRPSVRLSRSAVCLKLKSTHRTDTWHMDEREAEPDGDRDRQSRPLKYIVQILGQLCKPLSLKLGQIIKHY